MTVKNVLFVCVENSCRSQMAEAFANMHGQGIIKAYSSGSKPSGVVNPKAIYAMHQVGYDLTVHQSKSLDDIPDIEYEYAITMGCGDECPMVKAKHREDWQIPDPKLMDEHEFASVRDLIQSKVMDLLDQVK